MRIVEGNVSRGPTIFNIFHAKQNIYTIHTPHSKTKTKKQFIITQLSEQCQMLGHIFRRIRIMWFQSLNLIVLSGKCLNKKKCLVKATERLHFLLYIQY